MIFIDIVNSGGMEVVYGHICWVDLVNSGVRAVGC